MEHAAARAELSDSLAREAATREVLGVISRSTTELQPVLDTIARTAAGLCAAAFCHVFRFDGRMLHFAAHHGLAREGVEALRRAYPMAPNRGGAAMRAVLDRAIVHIPDVHLDREYTHGFLARMSTIRGLLAVPMLRGGEPIGAVVVARSDPGQFPQRQVELLQTFADQAVIAIENVRLFEEVQARTQELTESLERQTATSAVLGVISRSKFDIQPVLDTIVTTAARLCRAEWAVIFRLEADGRFHLAAVSDTNDENVRYMRENPILPGRGSVTGRAALEGRTVHIHDVLADPEYTAHGFQMKGGHRTGLGVPLLRGGEVIGVIALPRNIVKPYTENEIEIVTTFADQAVIAIENVRLFEEVQARTQELTESLERQTATSEVLGVISRSTTDLQPVLDSIVATAARLCQADYANIWRICPDDRYRMVSTNSAEAEIAKYMAEHPIAVDRGTLVGRTALERQAVHVADARADPEYTWSELTKFAKLRTMLGIPLLRSGVPIGVIALHRIVVKPFTEKQIELVTTFADQAVIAIENVRLFDEVQARTQELTESLERQTATSEVLNVISRSTTKLQPVLDAIVATAVRLCHAEVASISRLELGKYHVVATHGHEPEFIQYLRDNPISTDRRTMTGRVALEKRTIQVLDAQVDHEFSYGAHQISPIRTIVGVPLRRSEEVVGVIVLSRSFVRPFTERQIELVTTFADQAVIAIENVRLFEEVQARTQELTESLERQTATSEVLGVISRSTTDLQPVLDSIVKTAHHLCQADWAVICKEAGDGAFPAVASSDAQAEHFRYRIEHPWRPGRESVTGRALQQAHAVHVHDVAGDPDYRAQEAQVRGKYRTLLSVPLLRSGAPIGAITLGRQEVHPFSDKQVDLITTFADQAVIAIENVRLFEEVQARTRELTESLEQQTATSEILTVISRSLADTQPVFDAIVQSGLQLFPGASIVVAVPEGNSVRAVAFADSDPGQTEMLRSRFPPVPLTRDYLNGAAILDCTVIDISDAENGPPDLVAGCQRFLATGNRAVTIVPMLRGATAIGALSVARRVAGPLSDKQIAILRTFADQAVIAIENVRLFEEVQARTRELSRSVAELGALGKVGQAVSSSLDLETVLHTILINACELSDSGGGAIYVFDETRGDFELAAGYGMSEEMLAAVRLHRPRLGETIVGRCAALREAVQVSDLSREPHHPLFDAFIAAGIRGLLAVPILHQDRVVGALAVRRKRAGVFAPETVLLLQTFATQSALAIQNARLFREIEEKGRQLEQASQHKSQFLANMSHELRTPLNAIIGITEMLREEAEESQADSAEPLGRVQRAGKHLLGLINDVLDLSKIEAGKIELHEETVDLGVLARDLIVTAQPLADKNGNRLVLECAADIGAIDTDQMRLRQVLLNLLSNACKFTEKGTVTLSLARAPRNGSGGIAIAVTDSGIGMTPEQMAKLFTEFTQAEAGTSRKYGGTGLGLAISKRLVEMMGGNVGVESTPGKGSTFKVWLPEKPGTAPGTKASESTATGPATASASSAPTVLVIDDDADARDLMRRFLAREGFDTLTAADGSEGLRLARQFKPSLITLDVMMPRMDGWGVLKELQSDPALATIPVVMLSILDEQEKGFALGAADYLVKPFNRERLRAILARHRRLASGGRVLIVEDDDATRTHLRDMLLKEGCIVDVAEDGVAALARVEAEPPDLVLLDLMMPRMDGFQFLEAMRAKPGKADIPIVVLTAKDLTEDERRRLAGEAEKVLRKSLHSREELAAEIRRVLATASIATGMVGTDA